MPNNEPAIEPEAFLREQVAPRVARRIEELRAEIERLHRELADRLTAEATVALVLEGPDGGTWYMNIRDGQMTVVDASRRSRRSCACIRRAADWEALARAAGGAAPRWAPTSPASRIERLREITGHARVPPDDGRRRAPGRGPARARRRAAPACTLSMKAEDALRLQSGELRPEAAFIQGLVKLQGDITLAMQLGAVLFARR